MKSKIKKVIYLITALLIAPIAHAYNGVVDIEDQVGNHVYFPMVDSPTMKCIDGNLSVIYSGGNYTINLCNLQCYRFVEASSGKMGEVEIPNHIRIEDDHIYIELIQSNEVATLYRISGVMVKSFNASDSILSIDISNLETGQYILCTPTENIKFIKK
jgi:putative exporter of polyketide antibiotics